MANKIQALEGKRYQKQELLKQGEILFHSIRKLFDIEADLEEEFNKETDEELKKKLSEGLAILIGVKTKKKMEYARVTGLVAVIDLEIEEIEKRGSVVEAAVEESETAYMKKGYK